MRYRRHRLAEYLAARPDTAHLFWVCPAPHRQIERRAGSAGAIQQWAITDLLPQKSFRFARYLTVFHKKKLSELVRMLQPYTANSHLYLWYTFPGFPALSTLLPWRRVIYDRSDLWSAPISGKMSLIAKLRRRLIAEAEQKIVQRADLIFCTSDYLHQVTDGELPLEKRGRVITMENGVDYELFAAVSQSAVRQSPGQMVLGYIGGIKPKLDFGLLHEVAIRKPEWTLLLVGPDGTHGHSDFTRLLQCENVRWVDAVPPEAVPQYMRQLTVGLMPYKSSPYNQAVFPLKLFEFLASGKAAVGVHLPSTKKYEAESVYCCLDHSDPESLIQVCSQLGQTACTPEAVRKRQALAKAKDWPNIFSAMLEHVHEG
nr:glycosyltransferase [Sporolactobacillus mangiferae]